MSNNPEKRFNPSGDDLDVVFSDCMSPEQHRNLEFESCAFERCDFAKGGLIGCALVDCRFSDSELTMINFAGSTLNGVVFERCRLRGVDWTGLSDSLLSVEFHECILDFGNFDNLKLKKTPFLDCSAVEATFECSDLRESVFNGTKLTKATFRNADLRKADFRSSEDLVLNLAECRCDGMRLRLEDARGTLMMHGLRISP